MAILLNFDAFSTLGFFSSGRVNNFKRLQDAWASALGLPLDAVDGLLEIPKNAYYHIHRDDDASIAKFFF